MISVKWQHRTSKSGQISFGTRARVRIVDGVFEAPDDPVLAERLKALGHIPVPEKVTAEVITKVTGESQEGDPAPDEERPAGRKSGKKGR